MAPNEARIAPNRTAISRVEYCEDRELLGPPDLTLQQTKWLPFDYDAGSSPPPQPSFTGLRRSATPKLSKLIAFSFDSGRLGGIEAFNLIHRCACVLGMIEVVDLRTAHTF